MTFQSDMMTALDTFLADFGEAQVWIAAPFTGIPETGHALIETVGGGVVSSDMRVIGKKSVIGGAKKGEAVTYTDTLAGISALACTVVMVENDPGDLGPGWTRLHLKKA